MHLQLKHPSLTIEQVEATLRGCFHGLEFYYRSNTTYYSDRIPMDQRKSRVLVMRQPDGSAVSLYLYRGDVYFKATMARVGFWGFIRNMFRSGNSTALRDRAYECLHKAYGGKLWTQSDAFG